MIAWVIETFVATTLLMLLVLAIRKPVSRHFGPNIAYALWALPVLRLALPPLPESWRASAETPVAAASEVITYYMVDPISVPEAAATAATSVPVEAAPIDWLPIVVGLWAVGALAFLAYHMIAHGRFCARLLHRAKVERTVAEGRVHVIETDAATGPLAFGIWRKYVAFPRDFSERYDPLERNLALAHELGHHLRGDLIANWVALVVLALHWFNPIAWRAFRAFRADQELACDALVLSGRAPALRHAYGRAIVKSAHGGAVSAACHLHTINELKGRLRMLSKHDRKSRTRITAGVTGAAALTLAGLALTASGTQAAANLRADVGDAIGVDLQEPPAAPAAPEAPEPAPAAAPAPAPDGARTVKKIRIVTRDKDGKITITEDGDISTVHTGHKRIVIRDGKVVSGDGIPADMPVVMSARCGAPKDGDVKLERTDGKRRSITICTDRIEARSEAAVARGMAERDAALERAEASREAAMARAEASREAAIARGMASRDAALARAEASRAAADAAREIALESRSIAIASADMGKRHAMLGLKIARKSIEDQRNLTPAQRAAALKGIDDAIREVQSGKD
jgi:beta-lactamase regulating signal transducer with metallopeptidase domain